MQHLGLFEGEGNPPNKLSRTRLGRLQWGCNRAKPVESTQWVGRVLA